jgi:hypothetical protein
VFELGEQGWTWGCHLTLIRLAACFSRQTRTATMERDIHRFVFSIQLANVTETHEHAGDFKEW